MTKNALRLLCMATLVASAVPALAQEKKGQPPVVAAPANGTPKPPAPPAKGPKPFKEVITDKAKTQSGLFKIHQVEDKFYLEIPDALLGDDFLLVNRISKGAAGVRAGFNGFAGDIISETVIRFQKGPDDKIFLNKISYAERANDSTGMYLSVLNSSIQPILFAFDIKAFSKESNGSVIDITSLVTTDNDLLFFDQGDKRTFSLGAVQADKSYVVAVNAYPNNLNVKTVKTYSRVPAPPNPLLAALGISSGGSNTDPATFEINNSLILLPKKQMKPRHFDARVGYFNTSYVDFDANPQGVKGITLARRWKLEPKPGDEAKYLRGELVEPQKPIVYYIDPTTPKKWIPYLIQGVNDWQVAFEKAGFKNAIMAKLAPTPAEDSTWSLEDARYSAIVYKPSDVANASGPHVQDPRTGEIMESHINWYHNVMSLVHDWYMVQTAAVDPKARAMKFDDELMGQLIRFVSSHEVGHTLGLRHNFGSSCTVPVEKLRDKAWVEANGHTPSIMDYARFNYVAQPEDNIGQIGLFPRIGDYDKWAIEWGYRWYPENKTAEEEKATLSALTTEKLKNPRNWWGDGEGFYDDPRSQTEDLGDNAMKASTYGIKNLQRILPNLHTWTKQSLEGYTDLNTMYNQVIGQFGRYIGHVGRYFGGIERTTKIADQPGPIYAFTSKAKQKEAMDWMQQNVFKTPTWVIDPKFNALTNTPPTSVVASLQGRAIGSMLNSSVAGKLLRAEVEQPADAYPLNEMLTDLRKGIFTELAQRKPVDIYRRALQKDYTSRLINIVKPPAVAGATGALLSSGGSSSNSDFLSIAKAQLRTLQAEVKAALTTTADLSTKMHLQDLSDRIAAGLKID